MTRDEAKSRIWDLLPYASIPTDFDLDLIMKVVYHLSDTEYLRGFGDGLRYE